MARDGLWALTGAVIVVAELAEVAEVAPVAAAAAASARRVLRSKLRLVDRSSITSLSEG